MAQCTLLIQVPYRVCSDRDNIFEIKTFWILLCAMYIDQKKHKKRYHYSYTVVFPNLSYTPILDGSHPVYPIPKNPYMNPTPLMFINIHD